jgi:hypothetical protein
VAGGSGKNGSKGAGRGWNVCQRQVYIATTKHAIIYIKNKVSASKQKSANCHPATLPATLSKSQKQPLPLFHQSVAISANIVPINPIPSFSGPPQPPAATATHTTLPHCHPVTLPHCQPHFQKAKIQPLPHLHQSVAISANTSPIDPIPSSPQPPQPPASTATATPPRQPHCHTVK